MTDQEFDKELADLMAGDGPGKKKPAKKRRMMFWKSLSRKKKVAIGAAGAVVVLAAASFTMGGKKDAGIMVSTVPLEKGDIQEVLSISGPISGTDSAEVVSRLHAEIQEILVKEGDKVAAGQVLARLDPSDVQKEVEIAQNAYNLAVAERNDAQRQAENGYADALQAQQAAKRDYDRKAMLFAGGDVSQMEMEEARDALANASRQLTTFTLRGGRPVANESYDLRVQNAEFELEKKKKDLEETQVTSPIDGTVVRVNTKVGQFADKPEDERPMFIIENLDQLELEIKVSEYSIGKVAVGQPVTIRADILNGEVVEGVVASISPTGEEKGGGSTERVIPTTVAIADPNTKLIAGITARAEIILEEAEDALVIPGTALLQKEDGSLYVQKVENQILYWIPVETGVEGDVDLEVIPVEEGSLKAGDLIVTNAVAFLEDGTAVLSNAAN